mgnify:CR=1 FL=1
MGQNFADNFISNLIQPDSILAIQASIKYPELGRVAPFSSWDYINFGDNEQWDMHDVGLGDVYEDMYDGGNYIFTDLSLEGSDNYQFNDRWPLRYSPGETVADDPVFGVGSLYRTFYGTSFWGLAVQNNQSSFVEVAGNLGADGDGEVTAYTFTLDDYLVLVKQVAHGGDPSVNHVFIFKDNASISQSWSDDTDNDFHKVSGLEAGHDFIYLVIAGNKIEYNEETDEYIEEIDPSEFMDSIQTDGGRAIYKIWVTGNTDGSVWGDSNGFTDDSDIGAAAVYLGLLNDGESDYVYVEHAEGLESYGNGAENNGVDPSGWGSFSGTLKFLTQEEVDSLPSQELGYQYTQEQIGHIVASVLDVAGLQRTQDAASPTLQSICATANQLILNFSENIEIEGTAGLNPAYISVIVDGRSRRITTSSINESELTLGIHGTPLSNASSVEISYAPPSNILSQGFIADLNGNRLAAIESHSVAIFSSSLSIGKSGISKAYRDLVLTGSNPTDGYGNSQNNTITGNDANNTLSGLEGADTLIGKGGNDSYVVDNIDDIVIEMTTEGTDTVQSSVNYTLGTNIENLSLTGSGNLNGTGNELYNTITGNSGNNRLDGGTGADKLIGGKGDDTYMLESLGDAAVESFSQGTDTVIASFNYTLGDNIENLTLIGEDSLSATGNSLKNSIIGNDGNNLVDGKDGADVLTGLGGDDNFLISVRPIAFRSSSIDHITDFSSAQGDKIHISKSAFNIPATTATLSVVNGASALNSALASASLFVYDRTNGELYWNQNGITRGAGHGGVLTILDNKALLSAVDLVLV